MAYMCRRGYGECDACGFCEPVAENIYDEDISLKDDRYTVKEDV